MSKVRALRKMWKLWDVHTLTIYRVIDVCPRSYMMRETMNGYTAKLSFLASEQTARDAWALWTRPSQER